MPLSRKPNLHFRISEKLLQGVNIATNNDQSRRSAFIREAIIEKLIDAGEAPAVKNFLKRHKF